MLMFRFKGCREKGVLLPSLTIFTLSGFAADINTSLKVGLYLGRDQDNLLRMCDVKPLCRCRGVFFALDIGRVARMQNCVAFGGLSPSLQLQSASLHSALTRCSVRIMLQSRILYQFLDSASTYISFKNKMYHLSMRVC